MKMSIAIMLVVIAMCNAEPPRFRPFQRQTADSEAAPYAPRGWRPQGAAFNLPQQTYAAPPRTYGAPPPQTYGPPSTDYSPSEDADVTTTAEPATTTETETEATTDEPEVERLTDIRRSGKLQNVAVAANPVYLVVPQKQNFVYTFQRSAPLAAAAPPQTAFLTSSKLQALPLSGTVAASIYAPYGSYVQIYQ